MTAQEEEENVRWRIRPHDEALTQLETEAMMEFECPSPTMRGRVDRCGWFQHPPECSDRYCAYTQEGGGDLHGDLLGTVPIPPPLPGRTTTPEEQFGPITVTFPKRRSVSRTTTPEDIYGPWVDKEEPMTKPADPKLTLLLLDEEIIELNGEIRELAEQLETARTKVQQKAQDRADLQQALDTIERLTGGTDEE